MSELRSLAKFIVNLRLEDIPNQVKEMAKSCILDSFSASVGAIREPQVKMVRDEMLNAYGNLGHSSVWGCGEVCAGPTAAFLNALSGHTLELDDVHTRSKTHIGTVVVPAAWAAAQVLGCSGREFLAAVVCGYEAAARIGIGYNVSSHRNRGWHATSTAGIFGAAAACGKLMNLNENEMVSALGLAGTQAFGTWAFLGDGAGNKTLHPARAASAGYESALLARAGMTGPEHILDAPDGGLYGAMSDASDLSAVGRGLGVVWEILQVDIKPYPCCRSTHCAIDGALALRKEIDLHPDSIESICVNTYHVGYKQCGLSKGSLRPVSPIDAKFSIPYTVACAIVRGHVTVQDFAPDAIVETSVQTLLRKVKVSPTDRFTAVYPDHWGCEVVVTMKDGSVHCREISDASGSVLNPLTCEQMTEKAFALLWPYFGDSTSAIICRILHIEEQTFLQIV